MIERMANDEEELDDDALMAELGEMVSTHVDSRQVKTQK